MQKIIQNICKKTALFVVLICSAFIAQARQESSFQGDPYRDIRYSQAFDQADLYQKYKSMLIKNGCAYNVFTPEQIDQSVVDMDDAEYEKQLQNFQKECLAKLNSARFTTLAFPGIKTLTEMGLVAAAVAIIMKNTKEDSFGSSIGIINLAFNSVFSLPALIGTGYNLFSTPENALKELENHFAKNMCYIPKVLWPKIINSFTTARQNEFGCEAHTNFLTFTLNLTTYKPKQAILFKDNMSCEDVKNELAKRIHQFFSTYSISEGSESLYHIQINVAKFIDELIVNDGTTKLGQGPRYIYLHGVGGIGKTHFVQTLSSWFEELMPGSVPFEEIIINSSVDLEGNEQTPGALLKVLRNQLMQNKRGSIVMFDEATWLNDPCMISAAKRVFNGDRSKLSASYFGSNIDGTAVSLDMPPMLIFVASNDDIKDDALASRFDIVHYPIPSKKALLEHAIKIVDASKILKNAQIAWDEKTILDWIEKLSEKNYNYRYIAGNIEALFLGKKQAR